MAKPVGLEVSLAVAEAVRLCDADVVAAYPITPQTHIVEHLSDLVANGELDAEYIPVESEQSAMSSCLGSSAAGARTFTATSSQGLALMNEMLFIAPVLRTPIVMAIANRALSAPINIWNDHSDIMSVRDVGWLALFAENGQEALDLTILSFRIAEDRRVSLPVTINIDGFTLSHFIEPVLLPELEEVRKWLPPFDPLVKLDVANPISIGLLGTPESYTEARKITDDILLGSLPVVKEAFGEFREAFGREYKVVESYRADDAESILVTMGSISETAMTAVDELREDGESVGVARIRLWRPFPVEDFKKAVGHAKNLIVIDRHISMGVPDGPVALEVKSLFYHDPCDKKPVITNFVLGLGGRDVTRDDFKHIVKKAREHTRENCQTRFELVGVWEE
ncbi:MAG: pyruvate ferredoxin oxidoreductase [Deltaproteobacteria bacterium]|jgi:pyruvate ferredoxin oxidoreductase alpha subunit|nr:pyruvate ferredoxin oxidoreductase [Deltaproteobacteria bacterium]